MIKRNGLNNWKSPRMKWFNKNVGTTRILKDSSFIVFISMLTMHTRNFVIMFVILILCYSTGRFQRCCAYNMQAVPKGLVKTFRGGYIALQNFFLNKKPVSQTFNTNKDCLTIFSAYSQDFLWNLITLWVVHCYDMRRNNIDLDTL